jgi:DNA-binding NarL/FixJ family response regulator
MTGVLIVEDQQVLASALEIAIGTQPDMDCVGTAATVDDALAQVAVHWPDVVLMDIQLPGIDGIEGTRRIKAIHPDVSILILTAGATPVRLAAAAEAGAGAFLAKDGPFGDILAAIRNPMPGKMVVEGSALHQLIRHIPGPPQGQPGRPEPAAGEALPSNTMPQPPSGDQAGARSEARPSAEPRAAEPRAAEPRAAEPPAAEPPAAEPPAAEPPAATPDAAKLTAREQEVLGLMGEGLDPSAIAERLVLSVYTARGHVKNVMMKLGAHTQLEAVVLATKSGLLPPHRAELGG